LLHDNRATQKPLSRSGLTGKALKLFRLISFASLKIVRQAYISGNSRTGRMSNILARADQAVDDLLSAVRRMKLKNSTRASCHDS